MALNVAQFVNMFLVALFVGNEVGSRLVIHPSLDSLSLEADLQAEQALSRNFGRIMPAVMIATIASGVVVAILAHGHGSAFWLTVVGVACLAAMLGVTLTGNVPINDRVLELRPDTPVETWRSLRRRWNRLHSVRMVLDVAALTLFILAVMVSR
ncbi:MAG TPA: DUF1772 domain-containing protein [Actinomycetota bacterium]